MTAATHTLATAIEGSYGTVVFGNGVPALEGYVERAERDHIVFAVGEDVPPNGTTYHIIPLGAIAYYRFAQDAFA